MSSSRTKLAMRCGRCPTRIRVISSGRATAMRSAAKAFQRSYWKLFKLADIQKPDGTPKRCRPHMFRDTFAVELAARRRAYRSSLPAVGTLQREDHGTPLRAVLQSSAGTACSFRKAGLEEASSTASEEESFILKKTCETAGFRWR